ncbi:MAG TPA: 6,7-dimethyl-8-ribityllumazine synthase [Planctomycetota bacterium]
MAKVLDGSPKGRGRRVAIAVSRFNEIVTERLLDGARQTLRANGVQDADVTVCWVPGAFELPVACRWLWSTKKFDAVVMLGAVVRGGTDHYEYVCNGVTEGAVRLGLDLGLPLGFGVLTCSTMDQALARAGGDAGNKGSDAATAALAMADLRAQIGQPGSAAGN